MLKIAPFPYFYGRPREDLHAYVDYFVVVAKANQLPEDNYLTSFPSNLFGIAREWYSNVQPRPASWNELRKAFLFSFRPQAFQNH